MALYFLRDTVPEGPLPALRSQRIIGSSKIYQREDSFLFLRSSEICSGQQVQARSLQDSWTSHRFPQHFVYLYIDISFYISPSNSLDLQISSTGTLNIFSLFRFLYIWNLSYDGFCRAYVIQSLGFTLYERALRTYRQLVCTLSMVLLLISRLLFFGTFIGRGFGQRLTLLSFGIPRFTRRYRFFISLRFACLFSVIGHVVPGPFHSISSLRLGYKAMAYRSYDDI